jgi:hypothetical protein
VYRLPYSVCCDLVHWGLSMFKIVLLTLAIVASFSEGAVAQSFVPTIVVDEGHNGIGHATNPDEYQISAASGLIVDPGSYTFPLRADFKSVAPDALYLIVDVNHKYIARWLGPPDRTVLDATTLKLWPGSEPFRGFAAGDKLIIAIGIYRPDRSNLDAMWFGMVNVK